MQDRIRAICLGYQGKQVEFAVDFEQSGGTLVQQLEKLFQEEYKQVVRKEKEKFINDLEQLILVYNNNVLMSHLQGMRDQIEKESNT